MKSSASTIPAPFVPLSQRKSPDSWPMTMARLMATLRGYVTAERLINASLFQSSLRRRWSGSTSTNPDKATFASLYGIFVWFSKRGWVSEGGDNLRVGRSLFLSVWSTGQRALLVGLSTFLLCRLDALLVSFAWLHGSTAPTIEPLSVLCIIRPVFH